MHLLQAILFLFLLPLVVLSAEDYYKLLGISKNASEREIKKAYRSMSKKYHPDKNPDNDEAHQKFVSIANAYEALIDPETRQIYDRYGHEGLEQHKQNSGSGGSRQHHDPFDLFSRFFGGGGHFHRGARRGRDMELRLAVPLRYFYTGRTVSFSIEKQVICDVCEGSGSADGEVEECRTCSGRGMVIKKHMLAPGIYQQVQSQCGTCGGTGTAIKHPCKACGGSRIRRGKDSYDVHIEPGMATGQQITFENEADEHPDYIAGDLVVELVERTPELGMVFDEDVENVDEGDGENAKKKTADDSNSNPTIHTDGTFFRRKDSNLYWREVLSLREAWLGGWSRNLTHLDGHVVRLGRPRGQVVQPGTVEHVADEGMPIWRVEEEHGDGDGDRSGDRSGDGAGKFGDLVVEYVVILPDQMDTTMQNEIGALWDGWAVKIGIVSGAVGGDGPYEGSTLAHGEL